MGTRSKSTLLLNLTSTTSNNKKAQADHIYAHSAVSRNQHQQLISPTYPLVALPPTARRPSCITILPHYFQHSEYLDTTGDADNEKTPIVSRSKHILRLSSKVVKKRRASDQSFVPVDWNTESAPSPDSVKDRQNSSSTDTLELYLRKYATPVRRTTRVKKTQLELVLRTKRNGEDLSCLERRCSPVEDPTSTPPVGKKSARVVARKKKRVQDPTYRDCPSPKASVSPNLSVVASPTTTSPDVVHVSKAAAKKRRKIADPSFRPKRASTSDSADDGVATTKKVVKKRKMAGRKGMKKGAVKDAEGEDRPLRRRRKSLDLNGEYCADAGAVVPVEVMVTQEITVSKKRKADAVDDLEAVEEDERPAKKAKQSWVNWCPVM